MKIALGLLSLIAVLSVASAQTKTCPAKLEDDEQGDFKLGNSPKSFRGYPDREITAALRSDRENSRKLSTQKSLSAASETIKLHIGLQQTQLGEQSDKRLLDQEGSFKLAEHVGLHPVGYGGIGGIGSSGRDFELSAVAAGRVEDIANRGDTGPGMSWSHVGVNAVDDGAYGGFGSRTRLAVDACPANTMALSGEPQRVIFLPGVAAPFLV